MSPFRPPHDFECPVCFPPEDRPGLGIALVFLIALVSVVAVVLWLIESAL